MFRRFSIMSGRARIERFPMIGAKLAQPECHEIGVVDVGSNSVRVVVYRVEGRSLTPIFNEKVMAGLGRDVAHTGQLNADGVVSALAALARFRTLLRAMGVGTIHALATAAVRDSQDGEAFAQRVRDETGLALRIISGAQEASLSALGVLAGAPDASGLVGDLGGSSLELIRLSPEGPGVGESFPLGPLALMESWQADPEAVNLRIEAALALSETLVPPPGTFFAVGGAWRALGRIDMQLRDHPLHVLHHHEIGRPDVLKLTEFVRRAGRKGLERFGDAIARRADALPLAALLMERLVRHCGVERVILSSYGLREGVVFGQFAPETRAQDPLLAGAISFAAGNARARGFGAALARWIEPVMERGDAMISHPREAMLRAAACHLADLGGALHPEQRREGVFDLVLRAPFVGISHPERAFLALAVHHRYSKAGPQISAPALGLLTGAQRARAAMLGACMRLGTELSGRCEDLLTAFTLGMEGDAPRLSKPEHLQHLISEAVQRRLEALGAAIAAAD